MRQSLSMYKFPFGSVLQRSEGKVVSEDDAPNKLDEIANANTVLGDGSDSSSTEASMDLQASPDTSLEDATLPLEPSSVHLLETDGEKSPTQCESDKKANESVVVGDETELRSSTEASTDLQTSRDTSPEEAPLPEGGKSPIQDEADQKAHEKLVVVDERDLCSSTEPSTDLQASRDTAPEDAPLPLEPIDPPKINRLKSLSHGEVDKEANDTVVVGDEGDFSLEPSQIDPPEIDGGKFSKQDQADQTANESAVVGDERKLCSSTVVSTDLQASRDTTPEDLTVPLEPSPIDPRETDGGNSSTQDEANKNPNGNVVVGDETKSMRHSLSIYNFSFASVLQRSKGKVVSEVVDPDEADQTANENVIEAGGSDLCSSAETSMNLQVSTDTAPEDATCPLEPSLVHPPETDVEKSPTQDEAHKKAKENVVVGDVINMCRMYKFPFASVLRRSKGKIVPEDVASDKTDQKVHESGVVVDKSDLRCTIEVSADLQASPKTAPEDATIPLEPLSLEKCPTQELPREVPLSNPFLESGTVKRLVEYFAVISCKRESLCDMETDPASIPHGETREEGKSTEKKNNTEKLPTVEGCLRPTIAARYPLEDHDDNPLNPMILEFCFPTGIEITPTEEYQLPRVHYFVLTNEKGRNVYGVCLTIMEEYDSEGTDNMHEKTALDDSNYGNDIEINAKSKSKLLFIPKVLCLLSTWPYLTAFREYLAQLYRLATATDIMTVPVERYIVNFCSEIPAPPPGSYEIHLSILDSKIKFWAPKANLPIAYVALPYRILFECLDLEHVLDIFCAMIMEHKIVLLSSHFSILTICSEILCSMLFPMRWRHLYIPLLPRMLSPMLDAPVPYICGVVRDNWEYAMDMVARDAIVVDLDKNKITMGADTPSIPAPPEKKWNELQESLQVPLGCFFERVHGHEVSVSDAGIGSSFRSKSPMKSYSAIRATADSHQWQEKLESWDHAFNLAYTPNSEQLDDFFDDCHLGQTQWNKVQEAFLCFFVAILKDYQQFLVVPTPSHGLSGRPSFDLVSFLNSQPVNHVPFLRCMCKTQQFDDLISRRVYSPGEPELVLFDQSINAHVNRSLFTINKVKTPFLQAAESQKVRPWLKAKEPNEEGLSNLHFDRMYKSWPDKFDSSLFSTPRPVSKRISTEWDRQAHLIAQLRIENYDFEDDGAEFFRLYLERQKLVNLF